MNDQRYNIQIRQVEDGVEVPDGEFWFDGVISSKTLDTYHSRMDDKSLDNFVDDINTKGVALLDGHQNSELRNVIGRWFKAKRVGDQVMATAKMLRSNDDTPEELNVNEHIRRIEHGFYNKLSVGFYGHDDICDLCDNDIFDFRSGSKCSHWPGKSYEIDGQDVTCTYEIRDAHLAEASLVFDNANKDCEVFNVRNAPKEMIDWKSNGSKDEDLNELELLGRQYKDELIDALVIEAVRALGNDFDEEKQRAKYNKWSADEIKEQTEVYKKAQTFTGGRKINNDQPSVATNTLPHYVFG